MNAFKFEVGPALVAVAAVIMVGLLMWKGKLDSMEAIALLGAVLTQAGLKPALAKVPPSERITDPEMSKMDGGS